ncbi:exoskeleton protein RP43-like [Babylonia areolata]|uniref:exoskeleton protein RP43-like n=1 Tax=Babylonia areolata TaxID=304850 RepID=UPI003FD05A81
MDRTAVLLCTLLYFSAWASGVISQPHGDLNLCNYGWVKCNGTGGCIPLPFLCNGYNNCGDWEDEGNCHTSISVSTPRVTVPTCAPGEVKCNSTGICITMQVVCDGYNNCGDGEDEKECLNTLTPSGCGDMSVQKGSHNTISSMNYPYHNYTNHAQCFWHIIVNPSQFIRLEFDHVFDLEDDGAAQCQHDSLIVYQSYIYNILGTFCGNTAPSPMVVKSDHALVRFYSNDFGTGRGFAIRWTAVPPSTASPPTYPHTTPTPTTTTVATTPLTGLSPCREVTVLQGASGQLTSPGYSLTTSAHYPPSSHCAWRLLAPLHTFLVLHFHDFMLEASPSCTSDSLTVYDGGDETAAELGTFCGKYRPPGHNLQPWTTLPAVLFGWVEWRDVDLWSRGQLTVQCAVVVGLDKSNQVILLIAQRPQRGLPGLTTFTGSHVPQITPLPGTGCDGTAQPMTSASGVVTSPGYDGVSAYAGNQNCQWLITVTPGHVIELSFDAFDMEWTQGCSYDFVIVYDGGDYR